MDEAREADSPQLTDFEVELRKLQDAVARLESGDLALEDAFREWEAGCRSYAVCRRILASARSRIEALSRGFSGEEPVWELFETSGQDDPDDPEPEDTPDGAAPDS